jgi:cytochrome c
MQETFFVTFGRNKGPARKDFFRLYLLEYLIENTIRDTFRGALQIRNTALVKLHRPIVLNFTLPRVTLRHGNTRRARSIDQGRQLASLARMKIDDHGNPLSADAQRPSTSRLHRHVYVIGGALITWFVLAMWSFAGGGGLVDYLLFIVSAFLFVTAALSLILSRVGRGETSAPEPSLREWATWRYETWTGRLSGMAAAAQILLPIAAAPVGMTAIGIIYLTTLSGHPLRESAGLPASPAAGAAATPGARAENKPASTAQAPQSFDALVANASTERGAQVAKQCMVCHNLQEGQGPKVGPDLYGVVGRPVASITNFHYSAALKAKGGTWTFDALNKWLTNPRADVPGTAMTFAGISNEKQRADVVAYLNTLSARPMPTAKGPLGTSGQRPAPNGVLANQGSGESEAGKNDTVKPRPNPTGRSGQNSSGEAASIEQTAKPLQLSDSQRQQIRQYFASQSGQRMQTADFSLTIGAAVPQDVPLHKLPPELSSAMRGYQGDDYVLVGDQLVIVDPNARRVVALVPNVS